MASWSAVVYEIWLNRGIHIGGGLSTRLASGIIPSMKTLEAAKAAENFTRFLSKVLLHQESFKIVKRGVPCAYLIPAGERGCNSHEFAEDLASAEMTVEDRHALALAVRRGRKALKPLKNPWG